MTRGELLEFLTQQAKEFRKDKTSISRNYHLTDIKEVGVVVQLVETHLT